MDIQTAILIFQAIIFLYLLLIRIKQDKAMINQQQQEKVLNEALAGIRTGIDGMKERVTNLIEVLTARGNSMIDLSDEIALAQSLKDDLDNFTPENAPEKNLLEIGTTPDLPENLTEPTHDNLTEPTHDNLTESAHDNLTQDSCSNDSRNLQHETE